MKFDRSMFSEQNGTILGFSVIVKEVCLMLFGISALVGGVIIVIHNVTSVT